MTTPEGFVEVRKGRTVGWLAADLAGLGVEPFLGALEPLPGAKGRGGVGLLHLQGRELVVRPFRRGGALGRLLRDRYTGPSRVRRELEVLVALRAEGVPVVTPVAAVATKQHAFWRLRLCTERFAEALPAPAFLAAEPRRRAATAEAIGVLLKLAFAAGLQHPDLHLDNVLCAARGERVRAVLVDLDRARLAAPVAGPAMVPMLARLVRHAARHRQRLAAVPSRVEWLRGLRALGLDRPARAAMFREVAGVVAKALRRRRWLLR